MGASSNYIGKQRVKNLSQRSDLYGAWLTFHVWASLILAGALFVIWPNPLTFITAVILIGSRQLGMAVLMHDAAHGILFKSPKINHFVGHYVLAIPYGGHLASYRQYHLKHHKYAQRPEDPDLGLSAKFPVSRASLARKFLRDITGLTALKLRAGKIIMYVRAQNANGGEDQVFGPSSPWPFLIFNGVMLALLTIAGLWWAYFALWLLPLFTWFQVVLRLRNIAEHAMTTHNDNPLTHARTTQTNLLTRIFVAPYWVNYHVEHHAYMYVPCYRLPALHQALIGAGHGPEMDIKPGYLSVLKLASTS